MNALAELICIVLFIVLCVASCAKEGFCVVKDKEKHCFKIGE